MICDSNPLHTLYDAIPESPSALSAEDKSNLAYIDPKSFAVKKGYTKNPEAHRAMAEKFSGICLVLVILGAILDTILVFLAFNLKMGLAATPFAYLESAVYYGMLVIPTLLSLVAIVEVIAYWTKTKQKLVVPVISVIVTIVVFLLLLKIRELIIISSV